MKDYLLLGHNGYLGSYLRDKLDCDILNEKNIYNNGHSYKYIINCIGIVFRTNLYTHRLFYMLQATYFQVQECLGVIQFAFVFDIVFSHFVFTAWY